MSHWAEGHGTWESWGTWGLGDWETGVAWGTGVAGEEGWLGEQGRLGDSLSVTLSSKTRLSNLTVSVLNL